MRCTAGVARLHACGGRCTACIELVHGCSEGCIACIELVHGCSEGCTACIVLLHGCSGECTACIVLLHGCSGGCTAGVEHFHGCSAAVQLRNLRAAGRTVILRICSEGCSNKFLTSYSTRVSSRVGPFKSCVTTPCAGPFWNKKCTIQERMWPWPQISSCF